MTTQYADLGCLDDDPDNADWLRDTNARHAASSSAEKAAAEAAAFIFFRAPNEDGKQRYLLQNRSDGTWGLPGGKLHDGEEPWAGALRESEEELGSLPDGISPRLTLVNDDDGMTVSTFVVDLPEIFYPSMDGETPEESAGWAWVSRKKVADLPLNPAFEKTWDGINWKDLGSAAEKKFNPLEARDSHGRWVRGWVLVGREGYPDDNEGMNVHHPDLGHGIVNDIDDDADGSGELHADVQFDDGSTHRFRYADQEDTQLPAGLNRASTALPGSDVSEERAAAQVLDSEPKHKPLKFFDKTAGVSMKRLADAITAAGVKKSHPSLSPKPFNESKYERDNRLNFLIGGAPDIAYAVQHYVNPDSTINKNLRAANGDLSKLPDGDREDTETLDAELKKEKLTKAAAVYRGFTATDEKLAQLTPGSDYTDHAFTSTASDPDWARKFAVLRAFGEVPRAFLPRVTAHGGKPVIMKINVPKGNHMIKGESDISEWILPRDTAFHVDDVSPDGSLITVSVPADDPAAAGTPDVNMTYGQMTQMVDRYMSSHKAQKEITPAQVERLAGTGDEISFSGSIQLADDQVEKKFNPLELRDRKGRWTTNGVPALILGHPKTAKHVITYVPGVLSTTPDGHKRQIERIKALKDAADAKLKQAGKKEDTAFILWGYRAPKSLEGGAIRNYGVATAKRLKEYQDKLRAQNPDAHISVIGHSYGSFVSGLAASRHGMKADDLVLIGSPGVNAEHASELVTPADHVWVGAEKRDGVTFTSTRYGLGPNPAHPGFGARLFASNHPQKGEYMARHAHSTYFRSQSQALPNIASILTGDYDAVTPPGVTPESLFGHPGMVDDPRIIDPASMMANPIVTSAPFMSSALKARRVIDTNGQERWTDDPDDGDEYPAAGGGARQVPDNPRLGELAPGGTPYSQAGGEPPHWQPSQNLTAWSDDASDAGRAGANPWAGGTSGDIKDNSDSTHASHPEGGQDDEYGYTGVPPQNTADLEGPGDGKWPEGGHGTEQAGIWMPGGATGVPPAGMPVAQHVGDKDKPTPVWKNSVEDKVYQQLLENYPPDAIAWVKDAEWAGPMNVPQARIDDDAVKSWAASHQQDRVDHFVKKIEAGELIHPAVSVQEPGEDNVKIIDGHHRELAFKKLGLPLRTYLGKVDSNGGPWDETHSSQFHQGADSANKAATLSKDAVGYRETGSTDKRCGTCTMFREDGSCTLVKGDIDAYDVCDRWYPEEDGKAEKRFNPLQLRDSHGRWSRGDTQFGSGSGRSAEPSGSSADDGRSVVAGNGFKIDMSQMDGAHPDLREEVLSRTKIFAEKFPRAASTLTRIYTSYSPDDDVYATTHYNPLDGTSSIQLNLTYYGDKKTFTDSMIKMHQTGVHPLGQTQSVIDHELGHVLDNAQYDGSGASMPSNAAVWRFPSRLGSYSKSNSREAFAEGFSVWQAAHTGSLSRSTMDMKLNREEVSILSNLEANEGLRMTRSHPHYKQEGSEGPPESTCRGFITDEILAGLPEKPQTEENEAE
jgi:8-oxo-dGTP pyrophosphatase MutT (NUDIX family)/pimeloyl-ACP methyl ester carboxylesterase